tara:strand:+ start:230 stop:643 length:414 start_codon:yes stop_codon:yes gene_type:complete
LLYTEIKINNKLFLGETMKKFLLTTLLSIPLSVFSSTLVILECELLEGGTMDDVKRINSAWVEAVNQMGDKKVSSQVLEAVLADNTGGFMYIDTYQDSIHWGEIRYEIKNGAIQNIDDQFETVSKCTSGKMYDAEDS